MMQLQLYETMASVEALHWWFVGRRAILVDVIGEVCRDGAAEILEIGAGTGGNLDMLRRFGSVTAVESDAAARASAAAKSGLPVAPGELPHGLALESGKTFDLVCLFDVLEHVQQDQEALHVLHGLLAENGKVVLTVPAYQCLWSRHDVLHGHYRRYTRRELLRKCQRAGFTVERATYFNMLLLPVAAAVRLMENLAHTEKAAGLAVPSKPINALLIAVLSLERRLLSKIDLGCGLSLLMVLRSRS